MALKILFIGGTPRGLELFKLLIKRQENIVFACILKEDPHEIFRASEEIERLSVQNRIPFAICKSVNPELILPFSPDVAFVCGWRTLLPSALFDKVPFGCIAAHDSLLPKYRGFAPLNWAIINGERETGVTLFKIDNGGVDSGKIFDQVAVDIPIEENANGIYEKIIHGTLLLYERYLDALKEEKSILWRTQDETQATYTCKRIPEDGKIDWSKSAWEIYNLIRALPPPFPPTWTTCRSEKIYILKASLPQQVRYIGNIVGRIVKISNEGCTILCKDGQIVVHEVALDPRNPLPASQIFNSIALTLT